MVAPTSTRYGISQGRMLWCQGMRYLSRENQSIKLQQPTSKNPGLCTIQSPFYQDHRRISRNHDSSSQHPRTPRTQIQTQNRNQSTHSISCKNQQRTNHKSQQPAVRQAECKGSQRVRTKGPQPPKDSRTKPSTERNEFA